MGLNKMRGIIYDFKLSRPQVESPKGMSPQNFFSFLVYSFRRQVLWDTTSHLDTVEFRGCISRCGKVFDAISDPKFGGPFFEVKSLSHHLHHQFWLQTKTSHTTATIHLRLAFLFLRTIVRALLVLSGSKTRQLSKGENT